MDRETWLKIRNTPRRHPKRDNLVWQATSLVKLKDGPDRGAIIMLGKGRTYRRPSFTAEAGVKPDTEQ